MLLIVAWGPCEVDEGAVICPADINSDGFVGAADLVDLVLAWGACPGEQGSATSLEDELDAVGLDWEDWEEFLEHIEDENYRCWMHHYLTSPCGPFCPTGPDCPGSNPF